MTLTALAAACIPAAYLLGTFPSADLVARRKGHDVRTEGSKNPGASNVARLMGWRAAVFVMALDAAKGAVAAGAGYGIAGRAGAYVLGVAALLGHMFPVWKRFRGGKGVATAAGVMLVLFPAFTVAMGVVWFTLTKLVHKASVASLVVVVAYPVYAAVTGVAPWELGLLAGLAALVVLRHWRNVRRLVRGEELDLTVASPAAPGADAPGTVPKSRA